jgi:hypothetical protein
MAKPDAPLLTRRALNRATLARQMLLERAAVSPAEAIGRLFAMQAQGPRGPFVGLWSRVRGFEAEDLRRLIDERAVVRSTFLRATLHLTTAEDYLRFRTSQAPMLEAARALLGARAADIDIPGVLAAGRAHFGKAPAAFEDLRGAFAGVSPDADIRAMAYLVRVGVPLVQVPTAGAWRYPAGGEFTLAEAWLGRAPDPQDRLDEMVRRYLAAFGPASVSDAQTWSGFKSLKPVFERLRPELAVFRDEKKRELFDLPEAPRPDEDAPAPVRFLPEYDNLVLSHADRSRVISDEARKRVISKNLQVAPSVLVDGEVAGVWKSETKRGVGRLLIEPFGTLSKPVAQALESEGLDLLSLVEPQAQSYAVEITSPAGSP